MTENNEGHQVCYKHPDRKTYLCCNKCGRPICTDCAVLTPTGYRCKECVKEQQKVFNTSEPKDYVIGALIAAALGYLGSLIEGSIAFLPSILTAIIVGGLAGGLISRAVRKAVHKRRSNTLTIVVTVAAGLGGLLQRFGIFSFLLETGSYVMLLYNLLYIIVLCLTIWTDMNGTLSRW